MKHILNPQMLRAWSPINYFNRIFPWGYIHLHVAETTSHDIKTSLGIKYLMSLNGRYFVNKSLRLKQHQTRTTSSTLHNVESICQKGDYRCSTMSWISQQFTMIIVRWSWTQPKPQTITWKPSLIPHRSHVFSPWLNFLMNYVQIAKCNPHPYGNNYHITIPLPAVDQR